MEKNLESAYDHDDKIDDLENRSRRNNLIFFNIPEGREQNQFDCLEFMTDFLAEFVGVEDDFIIKRPHRTLLVLQEQVRENHGLWTFVFWTGDLRS